MNKPSYTVVHNTAANRFEVALDGELCVADYRLEGKLLHMTHTVVPSALEGQGIAAAMVQAALSWARSQGYKINPQCSYVRVYMQRHPEAQDLLQP
jgi:predicted GNAT family acetyltransferase